MPVTPSNSLILLTGASGFIGSWILKLLLERGYSVRAAVRNLDEADFLRRRLALHQEKLDFWVVEDIASPDIFPEALKDVSGVVHTASRVPSPGDEGVHPQEFIRPALHGTLNLLRSCINAGSVRRVVITSSAAALIDPADITPIHYTEDSWNVSCLANIGIDSPSTAKYAASKTLAEQAAWKFMREERPVFDLVTLVPSFVFGPPFNNTIQNSNMVLLQYLGKDADIDPVSLQNISELHCVDVRDLAEQHVRALTSPTAGNERIIASAHTICRQHILNVLHEHPVPGVEVPTGNPDILHGWSSTVTLSHERNDRILQVKYRPLSETVRGSIIAAMDYGWKQ